MLWNIIRVELSSLEVQSVFHNSSIAKGMEKVCYENIYSESFRPYRIFMKKNEDEF